MKCKIPRPPQNKRPKGLHYHSQQQRTGKGFNLPSDKKLTNIDVIQKAIQPTSKKTEYMNQYIATDNGCPTVDPFEAKPCGVDPTKIHSLLWAIHKIAIPRQSRLLKKLHFYKLYGYYAQASLLVCLERPSRITTTRNE